MSVPRLVALATATAAAGALLTAGTASANQLFDATVTGTGTGLTVSVQNHSNENVICTFTANPPFGKALPAQRVFTAKAHLKTVQTAPAATISRYWAWTIRCAYPLEIRLGPASSEMGSVYH